MKACLFIFVLITSVFAHANRCNSFLSGQNGQLSALTLKEAHQILFRFGILKPELIAKLEPNAKYNQIDHISTILVGQQFALRAIETKSFNPMFFETLIKSQQAVITNYVSQVFNSRKPMKPEVAEFIEKLAEVNVEIRRRYSRLGNEKPRLRELTRSQRDLVTYVAYNKATLEGNNIYLRLD